MMQIRMKAPYPMYDLEGGMGAPAKEYKATKGHAISRLRDNKALRVRSNSIDTWTHSLGPLLTRSYWRVSVRVVLLSTSATFTNKVLIKEHHVSAEMLTMCHLFISIILDCLASRWKVVTDFCGADVPELVDEFWGLAHAARAHAQHHVDRTAQSLLGPRQDAHVLELQRRTRVHHADVQGVAALLQRGAGLRAYRSRFSVATYSSLVPIVFGVVMASVSEMGMNDLAFSGVIFAVMSALLGVMQSMYAKFLLRRVSWLTRSIAFVSFAINAPFVLMAARAHQDNFVASFPFAKVLMCSMMHFVGSFCSSWVLGEVSELTFSIMSTMKRVVVILSAVLYFGNPVTFQSILGMGLAIGGVAAYQLLKISEKQSKMLPLPLTVKTSE
ncbi:Sugar phosphate transporter domain [Phytophthora cactorum]|nr:Sugar phosphate transporter domain [Phytophthora cactorum]